MNTLTAQEVNEFNIIRKSRDAKNVGMLSQLINGYDCSSFLQVEALLARAYVYLSDGQESIALADLNAARKFAPGNLEAEYLAEIIEGREFACSVNITAPSLSTGYPNGRPPSVSSSGSHMNGSLIPSGDSLSQTPLSMSTLSLDPGPQTPVHPQPQRAAPVQPSIIWEDLEVQRQQSLFKLQIVKGEVHKDNFCLAYDRPLIQLLPSLETVRDISFSIRSKHPVKLKGAYVLDGNGQLCSWFLINKVDMYHFATHKQPTKSLPLNKCHWESKEATFYEVIVCKIIFQGRDPPLPGNKAEGYIRFYFSNEESEVKIFQLVQTTPEEFYSIRHEKVSIEEYSAPQVRQQNRNVVSPNQNVDKFQQELEKRYPFKKLRDDECPKVHEVTPNSYKSALHKALFLEEFAHMDALNDLSLQTSFLEADKNKFPPGEGFFFVTFKCPYMVSEESVRGHALMNIATHVLISRMQDRLSSNFNVDILKADIVDRDFRTEIEQYSQNLQLKKEFRNLHFTIEIHVESFTKIFRNKSLQEEWFVEFGFDRCQFVECHYAVDQISDPSVLFASKNQLSVKKHPPWRIAFDDTDTQRLRETQKALNFFEFRDRYMFSDLLQKQQDACEAAQFDCKGQFYPPVVIHGPFGTGKTHTLSHATNMILESGRDARILICVVSRNTGNFYHQNLVDQNFGDCCLRLLGRNEDISHVDKQLLRYSNYYNGRFQRPTAEFIRYRSIVIVSVEAAMILHQIGINSSDFSHVFIDEAAQIAEFYLAPILAFASRSNRIVMTGDVMQLNPELLSVSLSRNFGHSIIERFTKLVYTKPCGFSYGLDVNYRSHTEIAGFAYKHFYPNIHYNDHQVDINRNDNISGVGRLMFVSVRGLQSLHDQLASTCNWVEADKIARVLHKLVREIKWNMQPKDIGILTAFKGQVQAIRDKANELRIHSSLYDVDTVRNMQGRQYRVIIVSLVTDVKTATSTFADPIKRENDLGFVTDRKLLCTALTRAVSSVIVVGDSIPLLLYPDAECFKVWDDFKNVTFHNESFHNEDQAALERRLHLTREDTIITERNLASSSG